MYRYACLNPVSSLGLDRFPENYSKVDDANEADVILVRSAKMHEMKLSDSVLAVARAGAGVNNIPIEEYAGRGVVVFNTPGANANGVKELVIAGMLLASRDIIGGVEWVKANINDPAIDKSVEKNKKQFAGTEISGKTLGVIGLGAIGRKVADAAFHLGMKVYGYDPYISVDGFENLADIVTQVKDVNEIYPVCDFITIHVPAAEGTKKMINADAIGRMKSNAVILNFARDVLVDDEALICALSEGRVKKYVTDFANAAIAKAVNVILIPHLGASTAESEDNCAVMAVDEIIDFVENGNIVNSVNYPRCLLGECSSKGRIALCFENGSDAADECAEILKKAGIGIKNSACESGKFAGYALFDTDSFVSDELLLDLEKTQGVLKVRKVK